MCRHCSADPSFRGFDLRVSPLGAPVVFAARGDLPFRRLPLGGLALPLGGLAFGLTASAFRHAPLRGCRSVGWPSGSRLPLFGTHRFGVALGGLVLLPSVSAFAARRVSASAFRFGDCRSAGWPSGSRLPLFGMRRFGVALGELALPPSASEIAARRVGLRAHASVFRHAPLQGCPRRVDLRAHDFRFSARTASGLPSAGWRFRLPLRGCPRRVGSSAFRFGVCRSAGWPSGSRLPLFGMRRFGDCPRRVGSSAFRFGDCRSAGWPSGSRLPLFGTHRFGIALGELVLLPSASELPLGGLAFGLTASAFRHAPLRSCRWASWFFCLPLRSCRLVGWPLGSRLPLFGTHRFAPPHCRSEDRRSTPTRHLFHFKTLIPTC